MGQLVLEKKEQGVSFVLCESCYWTASILHPRKRLSDCPLCAQKRIALMPIASNETYRYSLSQKGNLELQFSVRAATVPESDVDEQARR